MSGIRELEIAQENWKWSICGDRFTSSLNSPRNHHTWEVVLLKWHCWRASESLDLCCHKVRFASILLIFICERKINLGTSNSLNQREKSSLGTEAYKPASHFCSWVKWQQKWKATYLPHVLPTCESQDLYPKKLPLKVHHGNVNWWLIFTGAGKRGT